MNELYSADPAVCARASDLKLLLSSFGPFAGRYLANYPSDWTARVEKQFEGAGEVEGARIKTLLRRAHESIALVTRTKLPWDEKQDWLANAIQLLGATPPVFDGLVAMHPKPPAIHQLSELDLPTTADERIAGTASEYSRVCKMLLLLSPEIAFVDPYLNPLERKYFDVMKALFDVVAKGKSQKLTLWVRASVVFGTRNSSTIKMDLEGRLQQLARESKFKPGRPIEMLLVDDESRQAKMHDRYLLSIKGGVRLGQGFQQLPAGRQVDVSPIGQKTLDALLEIFFEDKHDMKIAERLSITL